MKNALDKLSISVYTVYIDREYTQYIQNKKNKRKFMEEQKKGTA